MQLNRQRLLQETLRRYLRRHSLPHLERLIAKTRVTDLATVLSAFSEKDQQLVFGGLACRAVDGSAAGAHRPAMAVEFGLAPGGDPADPAIGQQDPELRTVDTRLPGFQQQGAHPVPVIRMHLLDHSIQRHGLGRPEPEQLAPLAVGPGLAAAQVAGPDPQVGRAGRQHHC